VDAARLGQALGNLLTNAVTHTDPGGAVRLAARRGDDNTVSLVVADTGVGIPAADLPHVFERFFRVGGRDGTPGTGLGLAIVREIVEGHGGTVRCDSEPGKGTTFIITLPAVPGERPA
jgi:signal transduction histidine kinase